MSSDADGSKYTIPTGNGYLGVWKANSRRVKIAIGTFECVTWRSDDTVYAMRDPDGVALVGERLEDYITTVNVEKATVGTNVIVRRPVLEELAGFEGGGDIRAYERDAGGLLLVTAAQDPKVARTDGGTNSEDSMVVECDYCDANIHSPTDDHRDVEGNWRCHNCQYKALHDIQLANTKGELCDFCGLAITADRDRCPARDDGSCIPSIGAADVDENRLQARKPCIVSIAGNGGRSVNTAHSAVTISHRENMVSLGVTGYRPGIDANVQAFLTPAEARDRAHYLARAAFEADTGDSDPSLETCLNQLATVDDFELAHKLEIAIQGAIEGKLSLVQHALTAATERAAELQDSNDGNETAGSDQDEAQEGESA